MNVDEAAWRGRRVLLTGHTGFKGSWLALWLRRMGAVVAGYALEPDTTPALYPLLHAPGELDSTLADIRHAAAVRETVTRFAPEVVFHLAAQPLVRRSYEQPLYTYEVNVMGTAHVLQAVRECPSVRAVVVVTTDKVYENREWAWGYRESDTLGGHDPYSNSKACAELVTAAFRASFFRPGSDGALIASARAGNVIGGGDWAQDRLVPDLLRAFAQGRPAHIRHPHARRPWQHVLEPLCGYLVLAQRLLAGDAGCARAWNFGPLEQDNVTVGAVADRLAALWGDGASWTTDEQPQPHEAGLLALDCSLARQELGWRPRWRLDTALSHIVQWHQAHAGGADMRECSMRQISDYIEARSAT